MSRMDHAVEAGDMVDGIVLDQVERLLAQHLTPALLAACDGAVDATAWPADLWTALAESGLPLALVPEAEDGIGLAATTAARLLRRCGGADRCESFGLDESWIDLTGCTVSTGEVRAAPGWATGAGVPAVEAVGAWVRAQQMVGALESCLGSALDHAQERQQFGRPLAKFQAIQHMLAEAAGHVAAASAAADLAAACWGDPRFVLATAIAKARCGEAAGHVAAIGHQIHGAMGFTQEHPLHRATRRLWSWRDEFGSDALWQERIGRAVCAGGGAALWPMLVRLRGGAG